MSLDSKDQNLPKIGLTFIGRPGGDGAHHAYTSMCLLQEEFDEVVEAATEGLKVEPEDTTYNFCMGSALSKLGREVEAKPYLKKAAEYAVEDEEVQKEYYYFLKDQGLYQEAIEHLERAISLFPDSSAWFYNRKAVCHIRMDQQDEAKEALKNVLALDPDNIRARVNMGFVYMVEGQINRAYDFLDNIKTDDKYHWSVQCINLGAIFNYWGDVQNAHDYLQSFLESCDENDANKQRIEEQVLELQEKLKYGQDFPSFPDERDDKIKARFSFE